MGWLEVTVLIQGHISSGEEASEHRVNLGGELPAVGIARAEAPRQSTLPCLQLERRDEGTCGEGLVGVSLGKEDSKVITTVERALACTVSASITGVRLRLEKGSQ